MYLCGYVHISVDPTEGTGFPGADITGDCELSDVGAGIQAQVTCKSSTHF